MKQPLGTHASLERQVARPFDYAGANPNLKALRRIGFALVASAVLCFAVALTLIARTKPPQHSTSTIPVRWLCGGHCARIARGK